MENLEQTTQEEVVSSDNIEVELSEEQLIESIKSQAESFKNSEETVEEPKEEKEQQEEATDSTPEEQTEESNNEDEDLSKPFKKPIQLKDRDMLIDIKNMDELIQLANKGLNYTRKMQSISPKRKTLEYIDSKGISEDDLHLLADIKTGNKEAITSIAKRHNIDLYSLDADVEYVPNAQNKVPVYSEVEEIASEILSNDTLANTFKRMVQYTPDDFKAKLGTDPAILRGFATDVERGIAEKVLPEAIKITSINPNISFLDAYGMAYGEIYKQPAQSMPQKPQIEVKKQDMTVARAKAGIASKSQSNAPKNNSEVDIWEDGLSEGELMARIQNLANKYKG